MRYPVLPIIMAYFVGCVVLLSGEKKPNILWITGEDFSPEAVGVYGNPSARTPHIDKLAETGLVFERAYATAPICAPARSTLITGVYATSMGTQHLRSEVPVPEFLKTLPEVMRDEGYFTTNNAKTDYNFSPEGRWDELGSHAHWKNRPDERPFFSVFNYGLTHEGNGNKETFDHADLLLTRVDPASIDLPPHFPDTPEMRRLYARYFDLITVFDLTVKQHLDELEEAGLFENTIVFVFSDHGFGLPRYKRWLYDTGLHVPLVVHIPETYREAMKIDPGRRPELVSFLDFAPSVLHLAGADPHPTMMGKSFFDKDFHRPHVYGARSRADDVYNMGRAIVDDQFIYIRNFTPHRPYIEPAIIFHPESKGSSQELFRLKREGSLNPEAAAFWEPRPAEELYDLIHDPDELTNLAEKPEYRPILLEMRAQ